MTKGTLTVVALIPAVIGGGSLSGGLGFSLSATGAVGGTCVLLGATNLAPPVFWLPLVTNTADTNGVFCFTDPTATNRPQGFYRLQAQ